MFFRDVIGEKLCELINPFVIHTNDMVGQVFEDIPVRPNYNYTSEDDGEQRLLEV